MLYCLSNQGQQAILAPLTSPEYNHPLSLVDLPPKCLLVFFLLSTVVATVVTCLPLFFSVHCSQSHTVEMQL
jgi:hypothetical protein